MCRALKAVCGERSAVTGEQFIGAKRSPRITTSFESLPWVRKSQAPTHEPHWAFSRGTHAKKRSRALSSGPSMPESSEVMLPHEIKTGATPAVSIILPTYNRAAFLPEAFQSIRDQTFTDWELIVVDDGSTDQTSQCVADASQKIPQPVRHICQQN